MILTPPREARYVNGVKPPCPFSACLALTLSLALLAAPALALPQLRIDAPSEVDSLLGAIWRWRAR